MTRRGRQWMPIVPTPYAWNRVHNEYEYAFVNNRLRIIIHAESGWWLLAAPLARYAPVVTREQRRDIYTATDRVQRRRRNA